MKLENQVVNLEIAKRLKELGVKQESLFYWWILEKGDVVLEDYYSDTTTGHQSHDYQNVPYCYSAFTVAELGEFLPAFNPDSTPFQQLHCRKNRNSKGDEWSVVYYNQNKQTFSPFIFFADTEADARGKMLIYLLENNLTK